MFRNIIRESPFVNPTANEFFKIWGDSYRNDCSFLSTLRALVDPRMTPESPEIRLSFGESSLTAEQTKIHSAGTIVRVICERFYPNDTNYIYIHDMRGSVESAQANMCVIEEHFESKYTGWTRLKSITMFYKKQFNVLCFVNYELKSVAIFVEKLTHSRLHYLQCSILAFLPWYFDPEKGVNEDEMRLIKSLMESSSENYEKNLIALSKKYDFRTDKIKRLLSGFETKYEKIRCDNIRREIESILSSIREYNDQIGELIRNKNEKEIRLLGFETKIAKGGETSEIMDYFLCNQNLVLFNVTSTGVVFAVKTHLTYFDEEMALSAINNRSSYVYVREDYTISDDQIEKLMRAIFIDQKIKIKICAAYELDLYGTVTARSHFNFGYEFKDCMPNPHIDGYQCMGNYSSVINSLLTQHDYISAIEQCIASSQSLNFGDSTVMRLFMSVLNGESGYDYNNKCMELPDGSVVNTKEAIEWIERQENENE